MPNSDFNYPKLKDTISNGEVIRITDVHFPREKYFKGSRSYFVIHLDDGRVCISTMRINRDQLIAIMQDIRHHGEPVIAKFVISDDGRHKFEIPTEVELQKFKKEKTKSSV